jgi:hypothetical protein
MTQIPSTCTPHAHLVVDREKVVDYLLNDGHPDAVSGAAAVAYDGEYWCAVGRANRSREGLDPSRATLACGWLRPT